MAKFAIYYIPDGDFYQAGTEFLKYDIRQEKYLAKDFIPQAFKQRGASYAKKYGFHLTIGDAVEFSKEKLGEVEKELTEILSCFKPTNVFKLEKHPEKFVSRWGKNKEIVVLRYEPNTSLMTFQTMVTSRINPLGKSSFYYKNIDSLFKPGYKYNRVLKFYSPHIFDGYKPHFTLLNPYDGNNYIELKKYIEKKFLTYTEIIINSIFLVIKEEKEKHWKIYKEFYCNKQPQ